MPNETPKVPKRAGAHVRKHLEKKLAKRLNSRVEAVTHAHTCHDGCVDNVETGKCRNHGKKFRYTAVQVPKDHLLLSVEHLPDGGRIMVDMHIDDFADHLSHHADAPLTFASAKAALEAKHAATGADTGLLPFLERMHADGVLP